MFGGIETETLILLFTLETAWGKLLEKMRETEK